MKNTKSITFEISKAKNGEWKVTPRHRNGNIMFKESYKQRSTLRRILQNTIYRINIGDYKIVNKENLNADTRS